MERCAGFLGKRLGDQRLSRSGRSVQQHSPGRGYAQRGEHLRVLQREFDHVPDPLQLVVQSSHVVVGDAHALGVHKPFRGGLHDIEIGRLGDADHPCWHCAYHREDRKVAAEEYVGYGCLVPGDDGTVVESLPDEALLVLLYLELAVGDVRGQRDPLGSDLLPRDDPDGIAHSDVGAFPGVGVHVDHVLGLLVVLEDLTCGGLLAHYLHHVPDIYTQLCACGSTDPHSAQSFLGPPVGGLDLEHDAF